MHLLIPARAPWADMYAADPDEDDEDIDDPDRTPLVEVDPYEVVPGLTLRQWDALAEIVGRLDRLGRVGPISFDGRYVWLAGVTIRQWVGWWAWTELRHLPVTEVVLGEPGVCVSLDHPSLTGA